jgi:hypothetical protein
MSETFIFFAFITETFVVDALRVETLMELFNEERVAQDINEDVLFL